MPGITGLDANIDAGMGGSRLMAPGKHMLTIIKTEVGPTYDNTGQNIIAYMQDGLGAEVRHYMTFIGGAEPWMATNGQKQLRLMCEVTEVPWPITQTEMLHGRKFVGVIEHKESTKLKDDGTPFVNARLVNMMPAKAMTTGGSDTPPPPTDADADWI